MNKIRKNDTVEVVKGRAKYQFTKKEETDNQEESDTKSKPGRGEVIKVDKENNKVWVEGLTLVTKHQKPDQNNQGRIEKKEAPVDLSNVMLVDPTIDKPVRVGFKTLDNGTKVRYSKKTGHIFDK